MSTEKLRNPLCRLGLDPRRPSFRRGYYFKEELKIYGKSYQCKYSGSMFGKGALFFAVWDYATTNARNGTVEINPNFLAAVLGEDVDKVQEKIDELCAPDPKSRTKDEGGRRLIREGEYLYRVVNHERYANTRDEDHRREYMRDYMKERRAEPEPEPKKKHEAAPKPTSSEVESYCTSIGLPASDGSAMFLHWEEKGWGKVKNWKLTIQKWKAFGYLPSQKQAGAGRPSVKQVEQQKRADSLARLAKAQEELHGQGSI